jgi:PAS domain S-box-containing protein
LLTADEQFIKSAQGLTEPCASKRKIPHSHSFCRNVVATGAPVAVDDARTHPPLPSCPSVMNLDISAYLGVPICGPDGQVLGVLCVQDPAPRAWSAEDITTLSDLGRSVATEIAARIHRLEKERADAGDAIGVVKDLGDRGEILALAERSAEIGIWDVDLATNMTRGTPQFFRIMGLPPTAEPVPIETFRSMRHPDDRERVVGGFQQAIATGSDTYEMEYRVVRPDGQTRWIFGRGRVIRDDHGKPVRYSGVDIDVTRRKEAEVALAESQERLRLAQETAGIGTWDWDIVTGAMTWSDSQWNLYGLERRAQGASFEDWREAVHPEDRDRAAAALAAAVATRAPYEAEYRVTLPDGRVRWLAGRGTVIADDFDRPIRILGVNVDVTERRAAAEALEQLNKSLELRVSERTAELENEAAKRAEAEARLRQAQKMEAVGQLTGGIAHDFNNLLTVIIGNLDTVKRRLADESSNSRVTSLISRIMRSVEMAMQGANNAAQLTHRLLAFSRRQALDPRAIDLNKLVGSMSDLIGRTLSEIVTVDTKLAPELWLTFADTNQLESALLNLVVNARDAMPEGGRLIIETANVSFEDGYAAEVGGMARGQYVMLSVSDTGVGIPTEVLEKVFEPFFTTKDAGKGSGLGLSMVYGFVTQSGGQVRVFSEVGVGTIIKMYLPRLLTAAHDASAEIASERLKIEALPRAKSGETVLMVEDNEEVRRYGTEALSELGYRVFQATDGPAALRLLETEANSRIDLLFTDVVLPGGMSGKALTDRIIAIRPDLPVLLTTGYARHELVQEDLPPSIQLLTKPYTFETLATKVRETIDLRRATADVIPFKARGS